MKTTTDDGGPDPKLDQLLSYARDIRSDLEYIEARLLTHRDYTTLYFSKHLENMADMCRSFLDELK